jgi:hypothetical protein
MVPGKFTQHPEIYFYVTARVPLINTCLELLSAVCCPDGASTSTLQTLCVPTNENNPVIVGRCFNVFLSLVGGWLDFELFGREINLSTLFAYVLSCDSPGFVILLRPLYSAAGLTPLPL